MVIERLLQESDTSLFQGPAFSRDALLLMSVQNRPCKRRCVHSHMVGRDRRLHPFAADINLNLVVDEHVGGQVSESDRPPSCLFENLRVKPGAFAPVVGNHRAARHPADELSFTVNLHAGAHDAAPCKCDRGHLLRKDIHAAKVAVLDFLVGFKLLCKSRASDVIALLL